MDQDSGKNQGQGGGSQKQQLVERLKSANNILVTVRNNPTVDQLSACIGLTIMLNKLEKHATAVFSGAVPSTIEFLKPEETLEKNTDSLRDFIIALDKSKADKLRYKVEDEVVRIFITPYKTSISEKDLDFSQGDFNVDAVVAIGAHEQNDLDQAITSHGRILHDATVMSINNTSNGSLGTINWEDTRASSLSELVAELAKSFDKKVMDEQIATALLTGIVAETDRFRNEKTSPETMSVSAQLMSAGANQQLVASELDQPEKPVESTPVTNTNTPDDAPKPDDGTLEIDHVAGDTPHEETGNSPTESHDGIGNGELPAPVEPADTAAPTSDTEFNGLPPLPPEEELPQIRQLHDEPRLPNVPEPLSAVTGNNDNTGFVSEPPAMGGQLTANTEPEALDSALDPFGAKVPEKQPDAPLLNRDEPVLEPQDLQAPNPTPQAAAPQTEPIPAPEPDPVPPSPEPVPAAPLLPEREQPASEDHQTLTDLERSVHSPHLGESDEPAANAHDQAPAPAGDIDSARDEVLKALNDSTQQPLPPVSALNAQPLGDNLHPVDTQPPHQVPQVHVDSDGNLQLPQAPPESPVSPEHIEGASPADQPMTMPLPPTMQGNPSIPPPQNPSPDAPPPVPPPMLPPTQG